MIDTIEEAEVSRHTNGVSEHTSAAPEEQSEPTVGEWERKVRDQQRDRCSNCGGSDRIRVKMVVPEEAGGRLTLTNGVVLCRVCEMATDAIARGAPESEQRLVNFWVSRKLFDALQTGIHRYRAFNSMGALVRYLVAKFIADPDRFDDLEFWQDEGSDVKVNVWVERENYAQFRLILEGRGATVTDTLKALIMLYHDQTESKLEERAIVEEPEVRADPVLTSKG